VAPNVLAELDHSGAELIEVEDGFIRSAGLGADCVPPLSIVVDRLGVHFDPNAPSELEALLENGEFTPDILERARELRQTIVDQGISKYGSERAALPGRRSARRYILVPGQVEDDRAVLAGSEVIGNAELLRRVRKEAPNAHIIYKPHPDVEAGHRLGAIPPDLCAQLADEEVHGGPISSWIELVDEVQVNTSLAGFEALLRGKSVTCHGVPFYAGWGLTRDLGYVPDRRTARRSMEELVAAVLMLYPRYIDPVTGLPCTPEILIRRLSEDTSSAAKGAIVRLRRLQGRLKRAAAAIRFR
jgi:capsular polysaccharide export protein